MGLFMSSQGHQVARYAPQASLTRDPATIQPRANDLPATTFPTFTHLSHDPLPTMSTLNTQVC